MAVYQRGKTYWYSFIFAGRRIQESAKTHSKTVAKLAEKKRRRELEESFNDIGADTRPDRMRTVAQACEAYRENYGADHKPRSVVWVKQTLAAVEKHLGARLVAECTEERMRKYMEARKKEGIGPRRINMEVANLSRAIGRKWSVLWPTLRKQQEPEDIGRALSHEEEERLRAAVLESESAAARVGVFLALATGMRSFEIRELQWQQVDFERRMITVGDSKTEAGSRREIPMNEDVPGVLEAHRDWYVRQFGEAKPEWYLMPAGQRGRKHGKGRNEDPTRPIGSIKTAWNAIRKRANVDCRFHDLRHTVLTKMAENGVPESTMLAIMGHVSRKMLERYSHVRVNAKRKAVESLRFSSEPSTNSTTLAQR